MNFLSVFMHALNRCFCDVRLCYRLMVVAVKVMHTAYMHNILLESLLEFRLNGKTARCKGLFLKANKHCLKGE